MKSTQIICETNSSFQWVQWKHKLASANPNMIWKLSEQNWKDCALFGLIYFGLTDQLFQIPVLGRDVPYLQ